MCSFEVYAGCSANDCGDTPFIVAEATFFPQLGLPTGVLTTSTILKAGAANAPGPVPPSEPAGSPSPASQQPASQTAQLSKAKLSKAKQSQAKQS